MRGQDDRAATVARGFLGALLTAVGAAVVVGSILSAGSGSAMANLAMLAQMIVLPVVFVVATPIWIGVLLRRRRTPPAAHGTRSFPPDDHPVTRFVKQD